MDPSRPTVDYRLSSAAVVRMLGAAFVGLGVLTVVGTVLVAVTDVPARPLAVLLTVAVLLVLGLTAYLRFGAWVLRCTPEGYRVRLVRGAGVSEERWHSVEDAVTTMRHDVPCLVLRLRDGRTTTIPVGLLAADREEFVRDLQERLQRASGLRPWNPPAPGARE